MKPLFTAAFLFFLTFTTTSAEDCYKNCKLVFIDALETFEGLNIPMPWSVEWQYQKCLEACDGGNLPAESLPDVR